MNLIKLVPLIILLVLVVFGALKGLKNGFKNQAVRFGTIILALLLSIFVTGLLSDTLIASFENMSNESLHSLLDTIGYEVSEDVMNTITENTGSFTYLLAIPIAFIIAPIAFLLVYLIFHYITIIPYNIIAKSFVLKKEKKSAVDRLLGAGIGAVQGLLIAVIIASPFSGITTLVSDAADAIAEESVDFEEINETLELVPEDATISLLGTIGGNLIYENLATVDVHGQSYNMKDELAVPVIKLVSNASKLEDVNDFSKLTAEDKQTLDSIVEIFDDSQYISDVCSNLLLIVTEDVGDLLAGENVSGENEEATAVFTQFTDTFVKVMENIAKDSRDHKSSLSNDLGTILSVYYTLSDYEVLSTISTNPEYAVDSLMKVVETNAETGKKVTVMTKVVNTLNTNEHTRPMVTVLSQISVTALAGQFDLGNDVDITKVYDDVKSSVNAIKHVDRAQGEEIYVTEVSAILNDALIGNELDIEEDVINDMAQYIYDNPETIAVGDGDGNGELTDEEMNNLILSYYDVYVEYETSGEIPDGIPGEDLIPDGVID